MAKSLTEQLWINKDIYSENNQKIFRHHFNIKESGWSFGFEKGNFSFFPKDASNFLFVKFESNNKNIRLDYFLVPFFVCDAWWNKPTGNILDKKSDFEVLILEKEASNAERSVYYFFEKCSVSFLTGYINENDFNSDFIFQNSNIIDTSKRKQNILYNEIIKELKDDKFGIRHYSLEKLTMKIKNQELEFIKKLGGIKLMENYSKHIDSVNDQKIFQRKELYCFPKQFKNKKIYFEETPDRYYEKVLGFDFKKFLRNVNKLHI